MKAQGDAGSAGSDGVKHSVGFEGLDCFGERQAPMEAEPLPGVAMPLDIEGIASDPVEAGERRIELFAKIVWKARSITLDEAVFGAMPFPVNVDRIVEGRWPDRGKEARFQEHPDELLASVRYRGLFC